MAFFTEDFLRFFMDLAPNNHKDWFDVNRKRYEKSVKIPFHHFVQHLISKVATEDLAYTDLEAKDCIFRINRDIRFSKDKSPYKLFTSAVIAPQGKKSAAVNGVYFEFGPEYLRVYGGIYEIDKDDLYTVREGIARQPEVFKNLYQDPEFIATFGEIQGEKNKTLVEEFKEAAKTEALLYNKQWYFMAEYAPETILSPDLEQLILHCFRVGQPIEKFFNALIRR